MKILITTGRHYRDYPSGSARIAFDEAIELARRGEDVWVLASAASSKPEYEVQEGIKILRYSPPKVAPWRPARASVHQNGARDLLYRYLPRVDVIHGHTELTTVAALDVYGDSVLSCYTIHSPARMEMAIVWGKASILRRLTAPVGLYLINRTEEDCLRRSHVVTALSQYTIDCIHKVHGKELADKVQLIPGWVDTSRFIPISNRDHLKAQFGWPMGIPVLFTLRRLEWRMGLDRLLRACSLLLKRGLHFHLMIGGSGSMRNRLEKQARELRISNSVTFLGRISDEQLPLAYAACDAFVLPTAELECFGLIALEALSAGRPVLATPVGAIPEIIHKYDSSWLAKSANAEDIAKLLEQYLSGKIREYAPDQLHDQTDRDYNCDKVLDEFIGTTVCSQSRILKV
jgi:glycosyltransferase involved in cell wall biosynthesis